MRPRVGIRTLIGACTLAISLNSAMAQAPVSVKTWTFALAHGTLEIELQSSRNGGLALYIGPDHQGLEAPITEQVEPLKKVLVEMQGLGLDPHKLDYIGTRTFGRDVSESLAYACADSKEWQQSVKGHRWKEKGNLVVSLLNESAVYEPYNEAFKDYGIRVRVTEAEIAGLAPLPNLRPRHSHDRANAKMPVPYVYVGMRFSPINSTYKSKE